LLASGGLDKVVRIWNVSTGELEQTIRGQSGFVYYLAFTPTGDQLISCGHTGKLQLWNVAGGAETWSFNIPTLVQAAALAPDGSRLAIAGVDSKAYLVPLPRRAAS
jgi:WD40 repeat protein